MKHITIHLETSSSNHKTSFPTTTSFWQELWDTYTTDFNTVEIQCWKEEQRHVEELEKIASQIQDQNLILEFTITLNEENCAYLRENSIDENGGLKWFTLLFYKEATQMLEIGQYGSEISLYGIDETEADTFKSLFPESAEAEYFKEHLM
ncbi:MAG: hypothetical protein ABWX61_01225 [Paenisporosarcina sp.]